MDRPLFKFAPDKAQKRPGRENGRAFFFEWTPHPSRWRYAPPQDEDIELLI